MSQTRNSASLVHNHILYNGKTECQRSLTWQGLERETRTKGLQWPTFFTLSNMDQFGQISPVTGPMRGEIELSQVLKLVSQFVQQRPWQIRQCWHLSSTKADSR